MPALAEAETVAIGALAFLAASETLLPRFLALSGIDAGQVRQAAREPGFLAGVLQFMLDHEPTLLLFCQQDGVDPSGVAAAARALPQGDSRHEQST